MNENAGKSVAINGIDESKKINGISEIYGIDESKKKSGISMEDDAPWRIAGFWTRFWAYLVDLLVVSSVSSLAIFFLAQVLAPGEGLPADGIVVWLAGAGIGFLGIIGVAYFALMTYFFGQTLGKMIQGIRVIRTDGRALDWPTVLVREVAGRTISQLNGLHLGYIWARFHPRGFAWHDVLSDTLVVWEREAEQNHWYYVTTPESLSGASVSSEEPVSQSGAEAAPVSSAEQASSAPKDLM